MYGKKLTTEQNNIIWAHYKVKINRPDYHRKKKQLYTDIGVFVGCGWQSVYNSIRRTINEKQLKINFDE